MMGIVREGVAIFFFYSSYTMLIMALVTFLALYFWKTAPYGKFTASKGWGPLLPAWLCWMIMESPNLWNSLLIYILSDSYFGKEVKLPISSRTNQWLISLYLLHYINRSLIFPCFLSQGYPMPISVMFFAFIYCFWNSCNQATSLILLNEYDDDYWFSPPFLIGSAIFFFGLIVNIQSDLILINLKKQRTSHLSSDKKDDVAVACDVNKKGYVIPRGGFFEYVSSANYFGEIVEWIGFAIACQSIPALAFAVYTFANLAPRGIAQHKWYHENFPDYPKHRTAVIPFLV